MNGSIKILLFYLSTYTLRYTSRLILRLRADGLLLSYLCIASSVEYRPLRAHHQRKVVKHYYFCFCFCDCYLTTAFDGAFQKYSHVPNATLRKRKLFDGNNWLNDNDDDDDDDDGG